MNDNASPKEKSPLEIKQEFLYKRRHWMREVENFLTEVCDGQSAEFRIAAQQKLGMLFDMHTEIANAPLLHTLQAAAEIGMAMATASGAQFGGLEFEVDTSIAEENPDGTA